MNGFVKFCYGTLCTIHNNIYNETANIVQFCWFMKEAGSLMIFLRFSGYDGPSKDLTLRGL
jgi:hypothetical protein